jgi:hypothetical protein
MLGHPAEANRISTASQNQLLVPLLPIPQSHTESDNPVFLERSPYPILNGQKKLILSIGAASRPM